MNYSLRKIMQSFSVCARHYQRLTNQVTRTGPRQACQEVAVSAAVTECWGPRREPWAGWPGRQAALSCVPLPQCFSNDEHPPDCPAPNERQGWGSAVSEGMTGHLLSRAPHKWTLPEGREETTVTFLLADSGLKSPKGCF